MSLLPVQVRINPLLMLCLFSSPSKVDGDYVVDYNTTTNTCVNVTVRTIIFLPHSIYLTPDLQAHNLRQRRRGKNYACRNAGAAFWPGKIRCSRYRRRLVPPGSGGLKPSFSSFLIKFLRLHGVHLGMSDSLIT